MRRIKREYTSMSSERVNHYSRRSVAAPPPEGEHEHKDVVASKEPVDLTAAIATITQAGKVYSEAKLPPSIKTSFKRWRPERALDPPHDPNAYFPMILVK